MSMNPLRQTGYESSWACRLLMFFALGLAAAFAPLNSHARGGVDGGGGDIPQSSEHEVKEAIKEVFSTHMPEAFYNLGMSLKQVEDPYIKRILLKMFKRPVGTSGWEKTQPILEDIRKTTYHIEAAEDACVDSDGHAHAAGVASRDLGAPICFSVALLRLIPEPDLKKQILALTAHEFAHHFGFGEYEAVKLQTFFLHEGRELSEWSGRFFVDLKNIVVPAQTSSTIREIIFQNGKVISQTPRMGDANADEPLCRMIVRSGDSDLKEYFDNKVMPELTIRQSKIEAAYQVGAISCGAGRACFREMTYTINPFFDGSSYEAAGTRLARVGSGSSDSRINTIVCSGSNFHSTDIKRALGEHSDGPFLIKKP